MKKKSSAVLVPLEEMTVTELRREARSRRARGEAEHADELEHFAGVLKSHDLEALVLATSRDQVRAVMAANPLGIVPSDDAVERRFAGIQRLRYEATVRRITDEELAKKVAAGELRDNGDGTFSPVAH
jgi:hypothetical protein